MTTEVNSHPPPLLLWRVNLPMTTEVISHPPLESESCDDDRSHRSSFGSTCRFHSPMKMQAASPLIGGLGGEKEQWIQQSKEFRHKEFRHKEFSQSIAASLGQALLGLFLISSKLGWMIGACVCVCVCCVCTCDMCACVCNVCSVRACARSVGA